MANVLPDEKRVEVLAQLVNGASIRAAEKITGVHRDTIGRFAFAVGEGSVRLHDRIVRDVAAPLVDLDEQHSWVGRRAQNVPEGMDDSMIGEQWTWAAICRTSKLILGWVVGKRTQENADLLVADVRARLTVMPQITTDGLVMYAAPIAANFGPAVPYVQTVKRYTDRGSRTPTGEKFPPRRGVDFIEKRVISGAASVDLSKATTYAIERSNLTNRTWNARFNRRTLKFSKHLDRHRASVALMFVYRNLCHVQRNMRVSPAMAANVTDHVWELGEFMEAALAAPPCEKPVAQPLTIPRPEGTTRELPGDRGFLRALDGGNAPKPPSSPVTPPAVAAASSSAVRPAKRWEQLDLLAWRRPGVQMSLFGDADGGGPLS